MIRFLLRTLVWALALATATWLWNRLRGVAPPADAATPHAVPLSRDAVDALLGASGASPAQP
jgi:hypothetical protein